MPTSRSEAAPFTPAELQALDRQLPTGWEPRERSEPATVACNGCTLCCKSGELILVIDGEDPDYPYDVQVIEAGDRTFKALAQRPDGSCVYVTDTGCRIHGHAPLTCQVFDCAGLYASKTRRQRRIMEARDRSGYVRALYARGRELHRLKIGRLAQEH